MNYSWAIGFISIGLEGDLNDSTTTTNRITAPAGITFTIPNIAASGLSCAANLSPGDKQSIWMKASIYAGMASLNGFDICLQPYGEDVAS